MTQPLPRILDPHIHLWDQRRTPRKTSILVKALGWKPSLLIAAAQKLFPSDLIGFFGRPDYVIDDYLWSHYSDDTKGCEFAGFVHVQAGWEGRGPLGAVGETRWLEGLNLPKLLGIVGQADLSMGREVGKLLAAHKDASPRFRGIRDMLAHHPDPGVHSFCADFNRCWSPRWREGFAQLAVHGLSFDAWAYHHQLSDLAALARDIPEVPMVLCHAGTPVGVGGPLTGVGHSPAERAEIKKRWQEGLLKLAEHPQVCVKLSGFTMPCLGWGYHMGALPSAAQLIDDIGPLVRFVIDTFGAERCMFASNFPVDKVSTRWNVLFDAFNAITEDLTNAQRMALFHDNAARFYRLS